MSRLPFVVALLSISTPTALGLAAPDVDDTLRVIDAATDLVGLPELRYRAAAFDPELKVPRVTGPTIALPMPTIDKTLPLHAELPRPYARIPHNLFLLLPDGSLLSDATGDVHALEPSPLEPRDLPVSLAPARPDLRDIPRVGALAAGDLAPAGAHATFEQGVSRAATTELVAPPGGDGQVALVVAGSVAAIGLLGLLGLALYHRIRPASTLENETRKSIFEAVCLSPGLGVHDIADAARVSYSTATYHLERLIAAGMIVMTPDGNKLCYYKNGGAFTESERRLIPILKNAEATRLLEAILAHPGTYRAALASELGVTATTINWHLRRLREAGLIDETRQGRNAYLFPRVDHLSSTLRSLAMKLGAAQESSTARLLQYTTSGVVSPASGTVPASGS